eukprot:6213841-Pleurochrysis_carterae.AAC.1
MQYRRMRSAPPCLRFRLLLSDETPRLVNSASSPRPRFGAGLRAACARALRRAPRGGASGVGVAAAAAAAEPARAARGRRCRAR